MHQDTINKLNPRTSSPIITGEHLYAEAINTILISASRELLIFDQDLSHGEFSSLRKYDLFQKFLCHNPNSCITIILQNTAYFQERCPRLLILLKLYGHKMRVFETNETAKHAKDCFILADGQHYIKRIHVNQARFKYALNDRETVEVLHDRFQELLETTQNRMAVTKTGL